MQNSAGLLYYNYTVLSISLTASGAVCLWFSISKDVIGLLAFSIALLIPERIKLQK